MSEVVTGEPAGTLELVFGPAAELDVTAEGILDAALEQFELVGIRRSSVEDVARRAGVSRVTVYRRFPRKELLVEAMTIRECRRVIAEIDARIAPIEHLEERTAEAFVALLRTIREHPLFNRLIAVEPESVLRSLTINGAPLIAITTAYIAEQIRRGQRDGEIPPYEPEPVAEIVARFAHSLLLSPGGGVIALDDDEAARRYAREHLVAIALNG